VTQSFPQFILKNGQEDLAIKPGDVPGMTYAEVKELALPGVLETTGQITFDDRRVSTIVSRVQGRIENIKISLWDPVRRGQLIAELYSPDLMTAEAEYLQAQSTTRLSATAGPDDSADLAAEMVEAGRRKLELLGMEDADIAAIKGPSPTIWMRAPISGIVVQNQALIGSAISPGTVLYQLSTLDHVWITADIYEVDLGRVQAVRSSKQLLRRFPTRCLEVEFQGSARRSIPTRIPRKSDAKSRILEES
jgi:Cu(I)/Ag(I) efflux system membrane fusion protein